MKRTLYLLCTDFFLVGCIFRGVGDNQFLLQVSADIRDFFIVKFIRIIIAAIFKGSLPVIGKPFKPIFVPCGSFIFRAELFDGLSNNKSTFSLMVKAAVGLGCQAGITAVNEFITAELLENFWLQWFQRGLLILVSGEKGESQGNSVPVNEQSHLNDGIRPMFFAFPVLFDAIFLFDFKVEIRTVVV